MAKHSSQKPTTNGIQAVIAGMLIVIGIAIRSLINGPSVKIETELIVGQIKMQAGSSHYGKHAYLSIKPVGRGRKTVMLDDEGFGHSVSKVWLSKPYKDEFGDENQMLIATTNESQVFIWTISLFRNPTNNSCIRLEHRLDLNFNLRSEPEAESFDSCSFPNPSGPKEP